MPESPDAVSSRRRSFFEDLQLLIVILLGVVSVATAYVSFEAALYGGQQAAAYSRGGAAQTEAESIYLEANQQYMQDAETLTRLSEYQIEMDGADPDVAAAASEKYDQLYFTSVSEDLDAAIAWAQAENEADPSTYTDPQGSEDYQDALFGAWSDADAEAEALLAQGDEANQYSDRLTLNTVLMAIALFLLGIAAVIRNRRAQWILIGVSSGIFLLALGLTVIVPFTWF
ncbi:MAG: hypothetical protein BGO47_01215 [Microbacterium sp. 67-17]|uniref:hypothetical protein n=1 Tax=Microbacterium sp. 67-17 TaxID=1895782 RepID=UPI0009639F3C|nr:hypothetical protein [Microbacterium sp. 67-17]OJV98606.1 MAG: hypothetical protein BGO47_01215 [Microbacterium sp. 67-17]